MATAGGGSARIAEAAVGARAHEPPGSGAGASVCALRAALSARLGRGGGRLDARARAMGIPVINPGR